MTHKTRLAFIFLANLNNINSHWPPSVLGALEMLIVIKMVSMKPVFLVHRQFIQNKATTVYLYFFLSFFLFGRGILVKFPAGEKDV